MVREGVARGAAKEELHEGGAAAGVEEAALGLHVAKRKRASDCAGGESSIYRGAPQERDLCDTELLFTDGMTSGLRRGG